MKITLRNVTSSLPEYSSVKQLYTNAFPSNERAPFFLLQARAYSESSDFWSIYADGKWVGIAYVISCKKMSYLFYLAVAENERGQGFGSAILRTLRRMYEGQRFFLAIEPPEEANAPNREERIKRRQFYMKNGFKPVPFQIREGPMIYDVMSTSSELSADDFKELAESYLGKVIASALPMKMIPKEEKEEKADEA